VYLEDPSPETSDSESEVHREARVQLEELVEEPRERVAFLERALEGAWRSSATSRDRRGAEADQQPELATRLRKLEAPAHSQRPHRSRQEGTRQPAAPGQGDGDAPQEGSERPWWRRMFGA